jgi:hypothetical protein
MACRWNIREQNKMFTLKQKYMKTFFTLLLSTLFSLSLMAYDGTRLTVTSVSNQKIFVEVDGRRYTMTDNTVSIRNIRPGTHNVRVLREVKRKSGWNPGSVNKREEVIYSIKATMREGYHFDIMVNRFGKVMIDERRIDRNADWYSEEDDDYYENDRDKDWNNPRENRDYDEDDRYDKDRGDRTNRDYDDDDRYDRNDRDLRYNEMSDASFNQAKESLRKEWFENTRLSTAKQIIERNYFTSRQVKELVLLFTFENNRLDIAKYAYSKTIDKGNYFMINDCLSMSKNKEELNNFIREQR